MVNRRKVQLTGKSTLAISLPKEWTKRYGISAGKELFLVEEKDGSLVIRAEMEEKEKIRSITLDVDSFKTVNELQRAFLGRYLSGYDVIKIVSSGKIPTNIRRVIGDEVNRVVGIEVVEEGDNEIVVQDFFSHEGLSIEKTIKRAHIITTGMQEDMVELLINRDKTLAHNIINRDNEVDRLVFLILRQLNLSLQDSNLLRSLNLTTTDCLTLSAVIRHIEGIADNITRIARYTIEMIDIALPPNILKKLEELNSLSYSMHITATKAFFNNDVAKANDIIDSKPTLIKKGEEVKKVLLRAKNIPFQSAIIVDRIIRIGEYGGEIAEVVIDRAQ